MRVEARTADMVVHSFFYAYLAERNLPQSAACLMEDIQWVGAARGMIAHGRQETVALLEKTLRSDPLGYEIRFHEYREQPLAASCMVCFCKLALARRKNDGKVCALDIRATCICVDSPAGWKLASVHISAPTILPKQGECFPLRFTEEGRADFEQNVGRASFDLLSQSIPGGIIGCYLTSGLPLYYANERMLQYLGYSYEEFEQAIGGLLLNAVHPDDQDRLTQIMAEAFASAQDYKIRYRMRKKDGSWIWVNNIGRKGIADDGRAICFCVISDVSGEMETKLRLTAEIAEKERRALRYDNLFMSVLCGIVQYRVLPDGIVGFKNANREGIRIFGYSPEEFWARKEWSVATLVVEEDLQQVLNEIAGLKSLGDTNRFEYRQRRKDGSSCWVIGMAELIEDIDGEVLVQSVFLDINERKNAEFENRKLSARVEAGDVLLKMALQHTSTCEFFYYPLEGRAVIPSRTCGHYHCKAVYEHMPESLATDLVADEWRDAYDLMYRKILAGDKTAAAEFKAKTGEIWCRIIMSTVSNTENGLPSFVVGILEDITKAREMEFALEEARARDRLTGLYNREAGLRMVREYMESKNPEQVCAMMLLDMDNFNLLNKEEGKVFADAILQDVGKILRLETKKEDIQIRLGGDEFMLFIKDCDKAEATVLGPKIATMIQELSIAERPDLQVSASIGMCVTTVVDEYAGLYRCAESTLHYVKAHGKGKACCYLDTSNEVGTVLTQIYTREHLFNEIQSQADCHTDDLISFALELLGKARRLDDAITLLLARIGKYYGLDRVSIVESNADYLTINITYQWARNHIDEWGERTLYLTREEYEENFQHYDDEGLSHWTGNPRTMDSLLKIAIWNQGCYAGTMCLESRRSNYSWTSERCNMLKELAKLISSFIMKARADTVSRAKTDFLSRMSHEIRTPMNAISGMTTIAKSVLDDKDRTLDCLNKIEAANAYLLDLINDILDMSRIESGKIELNDEKADLGLQMEKLHALVEPQAAAKNIGLTFDNGYHANRAIYMDTLRLNQVLINIIGNAVKFTERGGHIQVLLVPVRETADHILIKFSVRDTGIGIDKASKHLIFNAFEQAGKSTVSKYGGTGLGLFISSRLVQMMGGTLEVTSEVGKGSEFYFTLPLRFCAPGASAPDTLRLEKLVPTDFRGARLLLAEDNELNREIAEAILSMHGFVVESAVDGQVACAMFEKHEPGYYRAILMDIRMPVMDGLEATKKIRTLGRRDSRAIPIIALTANAFDEDSKKSLESGMNGHLSKPVVIEDLLATLQRCLRDDTAPSPSSAIGARSERL